MSPQDKCALSFYKDVDSFDEAKQVHLVRHIENHRFFIRKTRVRYDISVYRQLQNADFTFVPKIEELIEDDGKLIIIEEYMGGQSLGDVLKDGPLAPERAVRIAYSLALAIAELQKLDPPIIHRDLKPDNIILTAYDQVTMVDFDTAKHISNSPVDTMILGTPGYAAPEQYGFGASHLKTDIYAFGVILNEMLCGQSVVYKIAQGPCRTLIQQCVLLEANARPSIQEICTFLHRLSDSLAEGNANTEPIPNEWKTAEDRKESAASAGTEQPGSHLSQKDGSQKETDSDSKTNEKFHPNRYPGFRRGKISHMLISTAVTVFMLSACWNSDSELFNPMQRFISSIFYTILFFYTVFFVCNYRNMRSKAYFARDPNPKKRVLGAILSYGKFFVISFVITIIVIYFFF